MELLFSLVIPSYLSVKNARGVKKETMLSIIPSWNDMLAMQHWARDKRKKEIQQAILSALQADAVDCLTKTTSARNLASIASDTLACYLETKLEGRKLKSAKKRLEKKNAKKLESKSSASELFA